MRGIIVRTVKGVLIVVGKIKRLKETFLTWIIVKERVEG